MTLSSTRRLIIDYPFVLLQAMLDAVISLQFSTVETIWRHFWRSANNNEAVDVGMEEDPEKMLPKYTDDLYLFCVFFSLPARGGM